MSYHVIVDDIPRGGAEGRGPGPGRGQRLRRPALLPRGHLPPAPGARGGGRRLGPGLPGEAPAAGPARSLSSTLDSR